MNMLDKHRILETGDEYLTNGAWKPVPAKDVGIQIMFTKYTQVRRPKEAPSKSHPAQTLAKGNHTISPSGKKPETRPLDAGNVLAGTVRAKHGEGSSAVVTAKAESDQVTRPAVARGTGERFSPTDQLIEDARRQAEADERDREKVVTNPADEAPPRKTESEKAMEKAVTTGVARREAHHHKTTLAETRWNEKDLIWTGRNGTFGCIGLEMANYTGDFVSLVPIGKRGKGNCIIQIPVASIPVIVDWLSKQTKKNTT